MSKHRKIKGLEGIIPSLSLWAARRAGRKDGKNSGQFQGITESKEPQNISEAYCSILWIQGKVGCYDKHCSILYQEGREKAESIANHIAQEKIIYLRDKDELASCEDAVLVTALKLEMQNTQEQVSKEKAQLEKLNLDLVSEIDEARGVLKNYVSQYLRGARQGGVRGKFPVFSPEYLPPIPTKKAYEDQIDNAFSQIREIIC